ncbi:hypothetical protein KEJ48_04075 [Candidatus Bathyarchaeota archaeon]|nr:hypothetical protein [Candidatus Bathyarchaeota archaeon]MBS7617360.1 hypothetical protein [Candidatus Bathyarchaeota archaeon]
MSVMFKKAEYVIVRKSDLERLLAKLKMRRLREAVLPPRKAGGGRPILKIFGMHHFPRYQPKPKLNPNQRLENYGRRTFVWCELKLPKTERVIIRSEPDAEQLLRALERNPKLYEKLSEKMDEDFDEQLEANINDAEKSEKEKSGGRREILESLDIKPDEEGKVDLGEVLERLADEEGMAIFPLGGLEVDEKAEPSEASELSEVNKEMNEPCMEIQERIEAQQTIEPAETEPSVLTQLEGQDLSSLEVELLQPEIEVEPV